MARPPVTQLAAASKWSAAAAKPGLAQKSKAISATRSIWAADTRVAAGVYMCGEDGYSTQVREPGDIA